MHCYRLTKYDPKNRNSKGHYTKDEWISVSDIGNTYDGKELTLSDYLLVEDKYSDAVENIMTETKITALKITEFEKHDFSSINDGDSDKHRRMYDSLEEGMTIIRDDISLVIKLILRETVWAKLVSPELEVHFGYDYYMYACCKHPLKTAIDQINEGGLFVESIESFLANYEIIDRIELLDIATITQWHSEASTIINNL